MFNILFLSNMMEAKGVWTLLDACRVLKKRGLAFHCHFVGKWSDVTESTFAKAVRADQLDDVITYHGAVYGDEKDKYWEDANVFVFPTHNECFGLVLLEAMQHHVACIATNEGGIPEIVDDNQTGFVVEKKDAKLIADKIQYLMEHPDICKQMGEAGFRKFKQKYTLDIFEHRMRDILMDAIDHIDGAHVERQTFRLGEINLIRGRAELAALPPGKLLINTINAHSYNVARQDKAFAAALTHGDALIPDGMSIVKAFRWKHWAHGPRERVAGADLFDMEMERLNDKGGRCFFLGSSEKVLCLIRQRAANDYPNIEIATYSPPYKPAFSAEESAAMVKAVNDADPDLLWIGMTAPKQEKWTYAHWGELNIHCHCGTIGAVFDFYAGTMKRASLSWQRHGLEWLYRLMKEPRRMWRRYIIGNILFVWNIARE